MAVNALLRIDMNVADPAAAEDFYCNGLGFEHGGSGDGCAVLRLGAQRIGLRAASGAPYPPGSTAADPWFQHIAIVVRDIAAAHAHLCGTVTINAVSRGGPQRLPPSSGSVTAFKFRDPDGHPLELIEFPPSVARWRDAPGLFLGIDHSAVVVADTDASIAFYTGALGMAVDARSVNSGPEQERLDGLADVLVDVVALRPALIATPHIELLGYRNPRVSRPPTSAANDIVATRMNLVADGLTPGLLTDPDYHRIAISPARP